MCIASVGACSGRGASFARRSPSGGSPAGMTSSMSTASAPNPPSPPGWPASPPSTRSSATTLGNAPRVGVCSAAHSTNIKSLQNRPGSASSIGCAPSRYEWPGKSSSPAGICRKSSAVGGSKTSASSTTPSSRPPRRRGPRLPARLFSPSAALFRGKAWMV